MVATSEIKYDTPTAVVFFLAGIALGSFLTLLFPTRNAGVENHDSLDKNGPGNDRARAKEETQRVPFPSRFGT